MPLLENIYRLSDYIEKQAIREKQRNQERFLTILPSYLEKRISGITDEKTLFSTIPKLSAELYQYGPAVGQAANQILGNLAQSKYKEISVAKEEQQQKDVIDILGDTYKGQKFEYGGKDVGVNDIITSMLSKGYDNEVLSRMLPGVLEASAYKTSGIVTPEKGGRVYYNEYSVSPKGGVKPGQRFEVVKTPSGMMLDDPNTPQIGDKPVTPEVLKYYADQAEYEMKSQDQLRKSLTLQASAYDIAEKKADEQYRKQIRKMTLFDRNTNERIYGDVNEQGVPYFFKAKEEPIQSEFMAPYLSGLKTAPTPFKTKNIVPVEDYSTIEQMGQQGKYTGVTASMIDQTWQNRGGQISKMADLLVNSYSVKPEDLKNSRYDNQYSYEKVLQALKDKDLLNEASQLQGLDQIYNQTMGGYTIPGTSQQQKQKPKW